MSNLLKSKFILGFMIVALLAVGAVASSVKAECSLGSTTLKYAQRSAAVTCLQTYLNVTPATGYFGKLTLAAVKAFQTNNSLKADGLVGKLSKAMIVAGGSVTPTPTGDLCPNGMTLASNCTVLPNGNPVNPTGPLTVSLATDNPVANNIVAGQAIADLAHFTFSGSGTLNQVTLQRTGISANTDLTNVYLFDGVVRVSDSASVNTNGVISFNNLNLAIAGTKTLSVKADILSSFGGTVGVTMTSYTVLGSTTPNTVSIAGNQMYGVTSSMATVAVGTVSPTSGTTTTVNAGTANFVLWSAPIQVNTRAVSVKSMAFQVIGSAPTDALQNVKLYSNGTQVGTASLVNALGYITFDMSAAPVVLQTGSTTLEVRGDIIKGSSRTVELALQNVSDFMVIDSQLSVNIASTGIPKAAATVSINSGSITVTQDPTFSATTVTAGVNNTVLAQYAFKAYGEDVKISYLDVLPSVSIDNVALYANGGQVSGNIQSYTLGGAALHFTLGSSLIVPAGQTVTVQVKADTKAAGINLGNATTVVMTLVGYPQNAQGQTSSTLTTVPSSNQTGPTLTVGIGGLTLAQTSGFVATQNILANTANQKVGSFTITAGSSEGVHLTNVAVDLTATGTNTLPVTSMSNLYIKYGSISSTPINPSASVNNFPVDITLAASANTVVDVYADVGSSTTVTNANDTQTLGDVVHTAAAAGAKATGKVTVTGTTGWDAGDTARVIINGSTSTYTAVGANESPTTVAAGLVVAINNNTAVNGSVTASNLLGVVTVQANTAGTAGNAITITVAKTVATGDGDIASAGAVLGTGTGTTAGAATTQQVDWVTPTNVEIGDIFTLGYNGTTVPYTATGTSATTVATHLYSLWNANSTLAAVATATDGTGKTVLTAVTGNVAYTYTATAVNGSHSSTGLAIQTTLSLSATGSTSNSSVVSSPTSLAGQTMTVAAGSVTVINALATSSPLAQFVVGGTTQQLATYTFTSAVGSAVIDELRFTSNVSGGTPLSTISVNGSAPQTVTNGGTTTLTNLGISVPMSYSGTPIVVTSTWNTVGIGAQATGQTAYITLTYVKYHVGNTTYYVNPTVNPASHTMYVAAAIPSLTATTTSSAGLISGASLNHLMDVTVAPSASGSINVNTINFTSTMSGITGSPQITSATLNIGTTPISGAVCTPTPDPITTTGTINCVLPASYTISGATTFSLYATVAGTLTAGVSSVTTSLTSAASFSWADTNGALSPSAVTGGTNTSYLINFPTNTWSIHN